MFKSSEDSVVESSLLCYISSGDYMKKLMFDCDDTLYDLSWPFRKCMEEFLPNVDVDMNQFYADYRKFGDMIFDVYNKERLRLMNLAFIVLRRLAKSMESILVIQKL